jgi:hypothetical protein
MVDTVRVCPVDFVEIGSYACREDGVVTTERRQPQHLAGVGGMGGQEVRLDGHLRGGPVHPSGQECVIENSDAVHSAVVVEVHRRPSVLRPAIRAQHQAVVESRR